MQTEKICPVCGRSFVTNRGNTVYCSATCRMQGYRHKLKDNAEAEELEREEAEKAKQKHADASRRRAKRERMKRRAAKGDPFAIMATAKPFSREYWQAYKDYSLQFSRESHEKTCRRTVNGISVNDPDFSEKVIATIEEAGAIVTDAYGLKEGS